MHAEANDIRLNFIGFRCENNKVLKWRCGGYKLAAVGNIVDV